MGFLPLQSHVIVLPAQEKQLAAGGGGEQHKEVSRAATRSDIMLLYSLVTALWEKREWGQGKALDLSFGQRLEHCIYEVDHCTAFWPCNTHHMTPTSHPLEHIICSLYNSTLPAGGGSIGTQSHPA